MKMDKDVRMTDGVIVTFEESGTDWNVTSVSNGVKKDHRYEHGISMLDNATSIALRILGRGSKVHWFANGQRQYVFARNLS